ncbi:hypothetical protein HY502_00950 [Candidatus Woesebacteria bacterium]|nr:hypothetical protein [Candidatus Woesebacteria bacterium]
MPPAQAPADQPTTPEPMVETPETPAEMPTGTPVPEEGQGEVGGGTPPAAPAV